MHNEKLKRLIVPAKKLGSYTMFPFMQKKPPKDLFWSPNGKYVICCHGDKVIINESKTGTPLAFTHNLTTSARFHPNETDIVSVGADKMIRIWRLPSSVLELLEGNPLIHQISAENEVHYVRVSPDGKFFAIACGLIKIYEFYHPFNLRFETGNEDFYTSIEFEQSGQGLLAFDLQGLVLFDTETGSKRQRVSTASQLFKFFFSSSNNYVVGLYGAGRFQIWNFETGQTVKDDQKEFLDEKKTTACLTLDERYLIYPHQKSLVMLNWKTDEKKILKNKKFKDPMTHISLSPDGNFLASCSPKGLISVWYLNEYL